MSSAKSQASQNFVIGTGQAAKQAYDTGFSGLSAQQQLLRGAEAEPQYLKDAFSVQRAGITEGGVVQGQRDMQAQLGATQQAAQGGNTSGNLSPDQMGAKMAQALYSSRLQEGIGKIEQANKLMGMRLGQSQQTGSAAIGAAGNALQNISLMPNYNPTYANVLGALNLAGTVYGGFANRGPAQNAGLGGWGGGATGAGFGEGAGAATGTGGLVGAGVGAWGLNG